MKYLNLAGLKVRKVFGSSLIKSSGIYTISSFINASIPFLLLPILTKLLSKADFGIVAMFSTVLSFILPFVGINMESAIARRYYNEGEQFSEYVGNCIIVSVISTSIMIVISYLLRNIISRYSSIPSGWIPLIAILCFAQFLGLISLTVFQVKVKPIFYGLFQITQSLVNFGLSILLICKYNMKWDGRVTAQILTGILFAIISIILLIKGRNVTFKINPVCIKHALKFGGGLIPHALGGMLIILTNRFFLLNMVNIEATGLYSLATQVSGVIGFFTLSFNNAFVPWLYNNLNKEDYNIKLKIVRFTYIYFILLIIMGIAFYLICPILFKIFINAKFFGSLKFLSWIVAGFIFQGMYFAVADYISYSEKTYYQATITFTVGLINIALNYYFIKIWGAKGAAMAFGACFLLLFLSTWILSNKIYKMPWLLTKAA